MQQLSKPLCASSIPRKLFERTYGKLFLAFSHCKLLELLPIRWQTANGLYLLLTCSSCILFYFRFINVYRNTVLASDYNGIIGDAYIILCNDVTNKMIQKTRLISFSQHLFAIVCTKFFFNPYAKSKPFQCKRSHLHTTHTMPFPD